MQGNPMEYGEEENGSEKKKGNHTHAPTKAKH